MRVDRERLAVPYGMFELVHEDSPLHVPRRAIIVVIKPHLRSHDTGNADLNLLGKVRGYCLFFRVSGDMIVQSLSESICEIVLGYDNLGPVRIDSAQMCWNMSEYVRYARLCLDMTKSDQSRPTSGIFSKLTLLSAICRNIWQATMCNSNFYLSFRITCY